MSNINEIKLNVKNTTIVAATKYVGSDAMVNLLNHGINNFGENRVDAFLIKYEELKGYDITWHFIGSLQTNKVKKVINKISYLHSLNSIKLASFVNKYRTSPLNCFLEINLTDSTTKTGINPSEIINVLEGIKEMENINVIGLMTMTEPLMTDEEKREVFLRLNKIKLDLNELGYTKITELSMGMSDDYLLAIESGATFVRLGRILFK